MREVGWTRGLTALALVTTFAVALLAACGSDGGEDGSSAPTDPAVAVGDPATAGSEESEPPPPPPAEDTGTITYASETVEVSGIALLTDRDVVQDPL